jgi:hypothetical protein
MAHWLHAEYRDFAGAPRMMLCTCALGTFLFESRFDTDAGEYLPYYAVYRLPPVSSSETCASWFGLETRAVERLADLPVSDFPFDPARREFLPYDSIEWLLRGHARPGEPIR